jgi:hypothetical protein
VAVESAAGTAKERMPGGVTAVVKKVAGLTVDTYQQVTTQQLAIAIVLADAVPVDWVSNSPTATPTPSESSSPCPRALRSSCWSNSRRSRPRHDHPRVFPAHRLPFGLTQRRSARS